MSLETPLPADRQHLALSRFNERLRRDLRSLISDELIEEHRRQPLGQHSDALERVLNFLRRPPRFALYSRTACREFQVIALPIVPGAAPEPVDDKIYTDEKEAMHAVFLYHVEALRSN